MLASSCVTCHIPCLILWSESATHFSLFSLCGTQAFVSVLYCGSTTPRADFRRRTTSATAIHDTVVLSVCYCSCVSGCVLRLSPQYCPYGSTKFFCSQLSNLALSFSLTAHSFSPAIFCKNRSVFTIIHQFLSNSPAPSAMNMKCSRLEIDV